MAAYEELLSRDPKWAFREGSMHFEKESAVHRTLQAIVSRFEQLGIPYAVAGGIALFFHGYRRFTEDVDILVDAQGLQKIHQHLTGLGYVPPFAGSKNLRDTESGVRIEFLVAGNYPGDGKPKPVAFPDPDTVAVEIEGIRFVGRSSLIELKLASGRRRDLADVVELIRILNLPEAFAERLDPSVRILYHELWEEVQDAPPQP